MADPIKVAVVGTGALGSHHVRLYSELATAGEVVVAGIFDQRESAAAALAKEFGVPQFSSLDQLIQEADAISVVTPTVTHFDLARSFLEQGKHVLVEKPMTETPAQAAELVSLSHQHNLVLQVGHVERFNPVFQYLTEVATQPRFIEAHRLSPFPARSTDIGVVLDLMIHDLDIVLAFVNSPVMSVDAVGIPVLSASEDIANARLRFENGCVANLTASRISPDRLRKIRVFSSGDPASYVSLDYKDQEGFIYRIAREDEEESSLFRKLLASTKKDLSVVSEFAGRRIVREPVPIKKDQPLKLELQSFIQCVQARQNPVVTGESGKAALDLAIEITEQITRGTPQ